MGSENELTELLHGLTRSHSAMLQAGADGERNRIRGIVSALEREYTRAQADEKARIPTGLSIAIEAVIALKPQGASPFAERRLKPRDDDMSVAGTKLVAGS